MSIPAGNGEDTGALRRRSVPIAGPDFPLVSSLHQFGSTSQMSLFTRVRGAARQGLSSHGKGRDGGCSRCAIENCPSRPTLCWEMKEAVQLQHQKLPFLSPKLSELSMPGVTDDSIHRQTRWGVAHVVL